MDSDFLFLLAIGVFYLFRQLSGAKKRPAGRGPVPQRPAGPPPEINQPRDAELDEALLEIRRALGMPVPEHSPSSSGNAPGRVPTQPGRTRERTGAFPGDDFLPVESGDPGSEERFEKVPPQKAMPTTREVTPAPFKAASTKILEAAAAPAGKQDVFAWHDPMRGHSHADKPSQVIAPVPAPPHPVRKQLASRASLREAMLLREILGPPVSRRRR